MDDADDAVKELESIADSLRERYLGKEKTDPWKGSRFDWIRTLPSRRRGKVGEELVKSLCKNRGLDVRSSPDSEADLIIEDRRVEVKFSTLWETGVYKFQQIRNQNYEFAVCLGISPRDAHCWVIRKDVLREHAIPQHTGAAGTETFWLAVNPGSPPSWLTKGQHGGRLSDGLNILEGWKHTR